MKYKDYLPSDKDKLFVDELTEKDGEEGFGIFGSYSGYCYDIPPVSSFEDAEKWMRENYPQEIIED